MSDSLSRYLVQLHSLLSSNALQRGVDANNTVVDLSSFCLENVSDREQAYCSSLLFHEETGIISFLKKAVALDEFLEARLELLKFLQLYVLKLGKRINPYVVTIKDICLKIFSQDRSSKAKAETLPLLAQIFQIKLDSSVVAELKVPKMIDKYFSACMTPTKYSSTVKYWLYSLLGTFAEVFPEYMISQSDRLVSMYISVLKSEIEVRTAICQLGEVSLREICAGLHIEVKETDTGRLALIQILTKYLDAEELGTEALTNLREAIKEKKPATKDVKSEQESGVKTEQEDQKSAIKSSTNTVMPKETTVTPPFRKEFKISGQIGDSRQKDRLNFTSLAHQINAGLKRGYKEEEIVEAFIRAINPGLRLRSYLEGRPDLELARLRKILRSHYQERGATEMYQMLSSAVQEAGETPQDFLVRLLDLKQKVLLDLKKQDQI
ncbi:hypothetical protein ACROYT_G037501 [Oculina patagonica]